MPNSTLLDVTILKETMLRYRTCDVNILLQRVMDDRLSEMMNYATFPRLWSNAVTMARMSERRTTFQQNLQRFRPTKEHLDLEYSKSLFSDWCDTHDIDETDFIELVHKVIDGQNGKKNCIFLHGCSNSGKTYFFIKPIQETLFTASDVSNLNSTDNFVYEDLNNARCCIMDEVSIPKHRMEDVKKLFAGEKLRINVKYMKGGEYIPKVPCVCASNYEPWFYSIQEQQTLINRMEYFIMKKPFEFDESMYNMSLDPRVYSLV